MEMAAQSGMDAMNSAETNPKERGLGKPCAGKPLARFDEGESSATGNRCAALSTLLNQVSTVSPSCRAEACGWLHALDAASTISGESLSDLEDAPNGDGSRQFYMGNQPG